MEKYHSLDAIDYKNEPSVTCPLFSPVCDMKAIQSEPILFFKRLLDLIDPSRYVYLEYSHGETTQKTQIINDKLQALQNAVPTIRKNILHMMSYVGKTEDPHQTWHVNTLKPVFTDISPTSWMLKTSAGHLVFNFQQFKQETGIPNFQYVNPEDLGTVVGQAPHGVNFLMFLENLQNLEINMKVIFDKICSFLTPGTVEDVGLPSEKSLENAQIEVPLGFYGMQKSVMVDGATLAWIIEEMKEKYPQISIFQQKKIDAPMIQKMLESFPNFVEDGLKSFEYNPKAPLLSGFQRIIAHLTKHIQTKAPTVASDLISAFVEDFVRNFFAVEAEHFYQMFDIFEEVQECAYDQKGQIITQIQNLVYQKDCPFSKTEFYKFLVPPSSENSAEALCVKISKELLSQNIVTPQTLCFVIEDPKNDTALGKILKVNVGELRRTHTQNSFLFQELSLKLPTAPTLSKKMEFTQETAKSEHYWNAMQKISQKFPDFLQSPSQTSNLHPLQVLESFEQEILDFALHNNEILASLTEDAIRNIVSSFCGIAFRKAKIVIHILETKMKVFLAAFPEETTPEMAVCPHYDSQKYENLEIERRQYVQYLARKQENLKPLHHQNLGLSPSIFKPELELFLKLPFMSDIFGKESEVLFLRFMSHIHNETF